MSHVFISYSKKNQAYARRLTDHLLALGFDVWIDDRIDYGQSWERVIFEAIDASAAFLVIMTPDSYKSDWVLRECQYAERRRKPQFPLLLAGEEFPRYGPTQYVNVRSGDLPPEDFYRRLDEVVARKAHSGALVTPGHDNTISVPPAPNAPLISKTVTVNPPPRLNRLVIGGLVSVVALLLVLVAVLSRPNPLEEQVKTLTLGTATMQQQIEDLSTQLTKEIPQASATPAPGQPFEISIQNVGVDAEQKNLSFEIHYTRFIPDAEIKRYRVALSNPNQPATRNSSDSNFFVSFDDPITAVTVALDKLSVASLFIDVLAYDQEDREVASASTDYTLPGSVEQVPPSETATSTSGEIGQIAFVSDQDGDQEIYVMNADGTNVRQLTTNTVVDTDPRWSPDGGQIVFASERIDGTSQIYVMDADGDDVQQLSGGGSHGTSPDWSPDGQRIVFASDTDGTQQIYVMNADGGDVVQLTNHSETSFFPRWSPDGSQIAFTALRDQNCCTVYTMDFDGNNLHEFAPDIGQAVYSLDWSPDGRQIVFDSNGMIYMMNLDGSELHLLTSDGLPAFPSLPDWSPDGQQIVFMSRDSQIRVVNADASNSHDITADSSELHAPTWRPAVVQDEASAFQVVTRNADWTPQFQTFEGVEMALVPVGCFMMGSEDGDSDEQPVERQCLDHPFWIERHEVTNEQFDRLNGTAENPGNWTDPQRPREMVNWYESHTFCQQRSARLPTEQEWEYAARGPDGLIYPWGDDFVEDYAVHKSNSGDETADVGSRPENASWVGALDMSGNVWEWVSTIYDTDERADAFPYPYHADDGRENPERTDVLRVLRGGSWRNDNTNLRAAARYRDDSIVSPTYVNNDIGFRCARDY